MNLHVSYNEWILAKKNLSFVFGKFRLEKFCFVWPLEQLGDIETSRCPRATVNNTGVHSINKYYIHSTYCNNKQQMIKVQLPKIISIFYQNIKTCTLCKSGISLTIWLSKNDSTYKWNSKLPISRDIWGNLKNHNFNIEYNT